MKLPNGFGTVYKLSGNRRNPYVAKKTKGWENDPKTGKSKQLYTVVGYYPTRKEALTALAEFNANPYDVNAAKVYPFFEYWYNLNDCEYLLSTPEGEHFKYRNYYDSYWSPLIETLGMKHRPHDTRHTCISMLTVAGVSDKVIKKIVCHKGQGVTEVVYTHFEIEELIDAINKI